MSSAEADASGETSTVEADLSDNLIYTTLAIGEEGDPYPLPESTTIDVLWNDYDPEGDKISVGTINGKPVDVGDSITLPGTKAVVTLNEDGTLTYKGGILDYYSSDPLVNCPPFRPDTWRKQRGSRISLRTGLCRRTISGSR